MSQRKFLNKLQDKLVLVFGGTSGIGYAVAEAVLEHGAKLIISGSNPDKLDRTVNRLRKSYPDVKDGQIVTLVNDLTQIDILENRLREQFHDVVSENGGQKIDHIVYTAGDSLNVGNGISDADIKYINSVMTVRAYAPIFIAKVIATSDFVSKSAATSFTITSGTAHIRPRKAWPVVSMLSGACQGLVKGLAYDLAPIRVNVVNPGLFQTELASKWPASALEKAKGDTLTKKIGQAEDIAEAYLYFMKDASVDGISIVSDNGKVLF
ncbi:putative short-chain dehydrogenase [Talaromyces proteolyticus]|uniref:Short-chain dehydrogenase n=1 Tax=Talaromyces proteolyticus TaxID=1131652 RepID=A0AAD4Q1N5_9EURO|nr:putative short-chain dehydrogenase [Talaromyces proteolyticus]KAH8705835.1 putative short-chain dehydrogenase [Talaromyces proteolyticus]